MKKPNPRRTKTSPAARLRPFWFLLLLVAIAAAAAGYWAATWPGFFPKTVAVTGNSVVSAQLIRNRAAIERRQNVWLQNMHAAAIRVAQIPYVKDARVRRALPASVTIEVTERSPFAVVHFGGGAVLVDRDLRVLGEASESSDGLPVLIASTQAVPVPGVFLKDPRAARLRDDFETLAAAHVAAARLWYDQFGDLIVQMRSGVQLLLGDEYDLNEKAALIGPILSQVGSAGKKIAAVDLRAPKTPVVRYAAKIR